MWLWLKDQKAFVYAAAFFVPIGLCWWKLHIDAEASYRAGEKDLGVGILFLIALMVTLCLAPFGLAFFAIGIAKVRHERRSKRSVAADSR